VQFVEEWHASHGALVERELSARLHQSLQQSSFGAAPWSGGGDSYRPGERAAHETSAKLAHLGIAVYCPPPSQSDEPPYHVSAPRFYVWDPASNPSAASAVGSSLKPERRISCGIQPQTRAPHQLRDPASNPSAASTAGTHIIRFL
jgi:hypothetical protein